MKGKFSFSFVSPEKDGTNLMGSFKREDSLGSEVR
jgi:hypothetical protein